MFTSNTMDSVQAQGKHLLEVIRSEKFLKLQGIFNEVPFFIYPYDPTQALEVARMKTTLIKNLKEQNPSVNVLEVNMYDLAIEILKGLGVWERLLGVEPEQSPQDFAELLRGMLEPDEDLAPAIANKVKAYGDYDVMFLTGFGQVFPYIRAHSLLSNLHAVITDHPVVTFFPGIYRQTDSTGSTLELFGKLKNDRYYRARNILEMEA